MAWGTGALNIDATRIEGETREAIATYIPEGQGDAHGLALTKYQQVVGETTLGRWPSDAVFNHDVDCTTERCGPNCAVAYLERQAEGVAKFFYCPKTSRRERDLGLPPKGNQHKSVKPLALCEWLYRLICPPNGTTLDPWCGAGSTGLAAVRLDGAWVGMDGDEHWLDLAATRMDALRRGDLD
jgi:site-specific DNA-methyltransferase (adenine-specific)